MRVQVRKPTRLLLLFSFSAMILTLLVTCACSAPETDVVRHLVIAELIQRTSVPESQIAIISIKFPGRDVATAQADILQAGAKSVDPERKFICQLQREDGRWRVETVREVNNPVSP